VGGVGFQEIIAGVRSPNCHALKSMANTESRIDLHVVIVLNQFCNNHATESIVVISTTWEENTVKLTQLVYCDFLRLTPDQGNDSGTGGLNKFDVCCHQVGVVSIETAVSIKVGVKGLR